MKENNIKILTQIEHVLHRTGRYVGSTKHIDQNMFILKDGKMVYEKINYVPALLKIVREAIDNAIDENIRTKGSFANKIKVEITDDGWISVLDNGRGIPVKKIKKDDHEIWGPEAAWCELRAGSNFDDEKDNTTIGQNGEGVSLTCILSKKFIGETSDGTKKCRIVCKDNLSEKDVKVSDCPDKYTAVKFLPDYPRFSLTNIDETHKNILRTDITNLAMSYPDITFYFNKEKINGKSFDKYVEQFGKPFETYESDNLSMAILCNDETDDFNYVHYINGVNVYEGGNPFNFLTDLIVLNAVHEKLSKKFKTMKKGDIKNKISMVVFVRNMVNPRFDNQVKSKCINPPSEVKEFVDDKELEKFVRKVTKNDSIVVPILELFQMKEELKHMKELTGLEKTKKFKCDKYLAPIGESKYLALCEGDSACGGISAVLGRNGIGYYACRGVPLNAYDSTSKDLLENKELTQIIQILGLKLSDKESRDCNYESVLIASDKDLDGERIFGLFNGFFAKYCKWMLIEGRIKRLRTPMILLKQKDKVYKHFFNFQDYNTYISKHDISKYDIKYVKGLGSFTEVELSQLITENGFDYFVETLTYDIKTDDVIIDNWLNSKKSDVRKEMLRQNHFNIFQI